MLAGAAARTGPGDRVGVEHAAGQPDEQVCPASPAVNAARCTGIQDDQRGTVAEMPWGQPPRSLRLPPPQGLAVGTRVDICVAVGDNLRIESLGITSALLTQSPGQVR